jgi:solute carrier family 41
VVLLLHICRLLVPCLWGRGTDPDSAAIPYLTALGDLLGGALLAAAFLLNRLAGGMEEPGSPATALNSTLAPMATQAGVS